MSWMRKGIVIETRLLKLIPGCGALTIWPFIFILPNTFFGADRDRIMLHEGMHLQDQFIWAMCCLFIGWPAGAIIWYALYCLVLPVWWNPHRYYFEFRAMRAEGLPLYEIVDRLRKPPYYLWGMK